MSSPAEQEYWPEFLERLHERSVKDLATDYGADPAELDAALAATTGDRPVQKEAWWPEVVREHASGSLRRLARRFATNPRRLRRGLARSGLRVGGSAVADEGLPNLVPFRDRLGKEPDRAIAAEAKVTIEAIKGERRRLGIEPYRMRPDAEEWGGRPAQPRTKKRQRRRWQEAPEPVIIRRSGLSDEDETTSTVPDEVDEPEIEPVAEPVSRAPVDSPQRRTAFRSVQVPPPIEEPDTNAKPAFGAILPSLASPAAPKPGGASRLSPEAGTRSRELRKRRRIVRPTTSERDQPPVKTSASMPRLAKPEARSPVRIIEPGADVIASLVDEPSAPPVPEAKPKVRKMPRKKVKAAAKKRPVGPRSEPAPEVAAPPPSELPPEPALPPEADLTPLPPAAEARMSASSGAYAWQVKIPGREETLLVLADDIEGALAVASEHLGGAPIAKARAWRLAEVLHDEKS